MEVYLAPDLQAKLTRLATEQGRDSRALVQEAVERLVDHDEWFLREVEKGLSAADRGEFIDHEDIGTLINTRYPGRCVSAGRSRPLTRLTAICDFIDQRDGPEAARRTALRIYEDVSALVTFPRRGRPGRKPGTRELVFPGLPFPAIYRVRKDAVETDRILHGAQKWP
jgi:toxin ParE1/3/4